MRTLWGLFLAATLVTQCGATYYVSTQGRDTNPGTSLDASWGSILHAANTARAPGDTVFVREGTYHESNVYPKSGAAEAWIVITAFPGDSVTVTPLPDHDSTHVHGVFTFDANSSYSEVSGFNIVGHLDLRGVGIFVDQASNVRIVNNRISQMYAAGIQLWGGGENVLVEGNDVSHTQARTMGDEGISVSNEAHGFRIVNNFVHDAPSDGIAVKDYSGPGLVHGNTVLRLGAVGIYIDSAHGIEVSGNRASYCRAGIALSSERAPGGDWIWPVGIDSVQVFNNLCHDNSGSGIEITIWDEHGGIYKPGTDPVKSNIRLFNNTCVRNSGGITNASMNTPHLEIRNNITAFNTVCQLRDVSEQALVDGNLIFPQSEKPWMEPLGTNPILVDPQFADSSFVLSPQSPALGLGATLDPD